MSKKIVSGKELPQAIGPYNLGVIAGGFVFSSGQIPVCPKTGNVVEGSIKEQTQQVLSNLENVLKAAGSGLDKVVKTTVFLKDMNHFSDMNEVYAQFFSAESAPARSAVEVARLPKDVLIEIEAIAEL